MPAKATHSAAMLVATAVLVGIAGCNTEAPGSEIICKEGFDLLSDDHLAEARSKFNEALVMEPGYAGAYFGLAELAEKAGQIETALGHLDRAIEGDSEFAWAFFSRSVLREGLGQAVEAGQDLDRAHELDPALEPITNGNLTMVDGRRVTYSPWKHH